jgi:hypothetical protein
LTFRQSLDGSARDIGARFITPMVRTLRTHAPSVRCRHGPSSTG